MEQVTATPKPGLNVRKEDGSLLDPGGETVTRNTYWIRRQKDGDVTLAPVGTAKAKTTAAAKA